MSVPEVSRRRCGNYIFGLTVGDLDGLGDTRIERSFCTRPNLPFQHPVSGGMTFKGTIAYSEQIAGTEHRMRALLDFHGKATTNAKVHLPDIDLQDS